MKENEIILEYDNQEMGFLPVELFRVKENGKRQVASFRLKDIVPYAKRDAVISVTIFYE